MDGLHINSGSVLINTKRHGQRKHNHDLPNSGSFECSKQSILSSMDKFVRTVQNMRGTILVPSRLRDMRLRQRLPECELANLVANSNRSKSSSFHSGVTGHSKKNSSSILNSNSTKHKYNSHFHSSHYHLLHNHLQDYHLGYHLHSQSPSSSASLDLDNGGGYSNRLNYDPTEMPSALMNADLFNFYSMLYDVKQQLLWGPASGQSTIFTNYNTNSDLNQSTLNQLNSTMANCTLNNNSDQTPLTPLNQTQCNLNKDHRAESTCSSGYSSNSSTRNSTTNLSFIQSPTIQQQCNLSQSTSSSTNSLSATPLTTRSASDVVKLHMNNNQLNDSTSSNSSIVSSDNCSSDVNSKLVVDSPQSKTPQSDSDLESELESDSILTDRISEQITDQTQLLASAFRHHLQALHTILDQLTHSAEYLSRNYELDLGESNN